MADLKEHIMTESEQLQAATTELEEALDYVESLNGMWHWRSIHRNDEGAFKSVQAFLDKHGRSSKSCEF
jgi:hypothetical protein